MATASPTPAKSVLSENAVWKMRTARRSTCQPDAHRDVVSLWDGETESFVYQDVGELLEQVNPLTKGVAQEATDYAGAFSSLADHFGFKRGGLVSQR